MKTALLIAEHFPPSFSVGGKRPYRFARYLPDCGWRPVVLTRRAPTSERADPTPHPMPEVAVVDRSLMPRWVAEPAGRPSDGTKAAPTVDKPRTEPTLARRALALAAMPMGPWRLLGPWFQSRIRNLVKQHRPDVIYVTSSPYYLLEVGIWAARWSGLPLCLDLRDPWSLNFNQAHKAAWVRRREARLERSFFERADRVIVTCDRLLEAYRELHCELPSDRFKRIYNAFDPAMRPTARKQEHTRERSIDLVHFGNCYGPRKLATVIEAVSELRKRKLAGADRLRIVNLGRPARTDLDLAGRLGLADAFAWEPYLPYKEGLARLAQADAQLLLGYGGETLYVPAKTFDYLLTGAPIIALTGSSELAGIVETTQTGFVAGPDDVAGVANAVAKIVDAVVGERRIATPNEAAVAQYSAATTASQLGEVFSALCRR